MTLERTGVAVVAVATAAPFGYAALRALEVPTAAAVPLLGILSVPVVAAVARRLSPALDGAWRRRRLLAVLWVALGAAAVVQTARLGAFMLDVSRRQHSMLPLYDTIANHSCLSAYHRATELVRDGAASPYQPSRYVGRIGPLNVETFEYAPPFLLLPRLALGMVGDDFLRLRALWFCLMGATVIAGLVVLARWVGGAEGTTPGLLAPAVLSAMPTLLSLQYGNFHLAAVALAVLAMVAFERGRPAVGGALLSFVTFAKIFPGVLLVPMLVQRRWGALTWTAVFALVWGALTLALFGTRPFAAFVAEHLPRVATGAAFPFLAENPRVIAANMSAYALVLKLGLLGVPGMSHGVAKTVSLAYAVALVAAVALAARGAHGAARLDQARTWTATLYLAALASPFAPNPYAPFAALWLVTLLVPDALRSRRMAALLALAWLALAVMAFALPIRGTTPLVLASLVGHGAGLGLAVWALLRRRPPISASIRADERNRL